MVLFGAAHVFFICAIAVLAVALSWHCRRKPASARRVRLFIGWSILINEVVWWVFRYSHEGLHATNLPLQLCDLTLWLAVVATLFARPAVVEFAYFAGIAGAGMATLTPDLWTPWPSYPALYFFLCHGGIIIAVAVMVFGNIVPLRPGAVWRAFGWLLAYAAAVGAVNAITGANYMYLNHKPKGASPLDSFGPWPIYLLVGGAVALMLFWLLWIPVRPRKQS